MRLTPAVKRLLPELLPLLLQMPDGQHFDLSDTSLGGPLELSFQCDKQADVQRVRVHFPGVIWKKSFSEGYNTDWWEYRAAWKGIKLHIYACREAPPTCQRIEEEVEVEEAVPVAYETRTVKKTVVRWLCPEDAAGQEVSA